MPKLSRDQIYRPYGHKFRSSQARTKHPSGLTIVEIINHAANFGKHDDEWSLFPPNPCEALDALFVHYNEYSLTTILRALVFARSNRLQAFSRTFVRGAMRCSTGDPP